MWIVINITLLILTVITKLNFKNFLFLFKKKEFDPTTIFIFDILKEKNYLRLFYFIGYN